MAKAKPDLPQGTFDMLVLKALSLGPIHGYGVGRRIQQLSDAIVASYSRGRPRPELVVLRVPMPAAVTSVPPTPDR